MVINMKKNLRRAILSLIVVAVMLCSTSCASVGVGGLLGALGGSDDYMTRKEVEELLSGIENNITIDNINDYNISIDSGENRNLLAASKALLSAVSIHCTFEVTYTTTWPSYGSHTSEVSSAGAGVIYKLDKAKGDAYIITNYHVVYNADADTAASDGVSDEIYVYLYGQEYDDYKIAAEYVGGSMNYDIAVLRVKGSRVIMNSNAVAATFADSNDIAVLDTAIAIGNPEDCGISATVGSVNVDSERLTMSAISGNGTTTLRVIRIDAAVNSGNSGGGLFNDKGELIGIVNAKMSSSAVDNIGYAIPSNVAKYVADNIIYYDSLDPANDSVYRIMLGINVGIKEAYTEYDTESGRVYKREQVVITGTTSGSAVTGILKSDDVIQAIVIDGVRHEVVRTFNVVDAMLNARTNGTVVFEIVRDGVQMTVNVDVSGITPQAY